MKVICCSFNITNRRALAAELGFCDHDHPASEHDILLGAYAKWGERMGDHIYGGFALAILDGEKLFCVRDPFGLETFYTIHQE